MKKIIIAIDSFKGCLTSAEAGKAAEKGIKSINPSCHTSVIPIADGGEGLLDVLITATKGKYITLSAHGPLMKMTKTHYGLSGNGRTAIIEMAAISGLPLVPMEQRNPMLTTTFGTGELIKDALNKGCRNFIIGIGGSATNDAGIRNATGTRFPLSRQIRAYLRYRRPNNGSRGKHRHIRYSPRTKRNTLHGSM